MDTVPKDFNVKVLIDAARVAMNNPDNNHLMKTLRSGQAVKLPLVLKIEGYSERTVLVDIDPEDVLIETKNKL
jgi:hypothetical protein